MRDTRGAADPLGLILFICLRSQTTQYLNAMLFTDRPLLCVEVYYKASIIIYLNAATSGWRRIDY